MKTVIKRMAAIAVVCAIVIVTPVVAMAETSTQTTFVRQDSPMLGQGGYIYYIRTNDENAMSEIYRKNVSTGKESLVVSCDNVINKMQISGQKLYYSCADETEFGFDTYCCDLNGTNDEFCCEGTIAYADSVNVYAIKLLEDGSSKLYQKNLLTGKQISIKTVKSNEVIEFVTNINGDSYYYVYRSGDSRLILYLLGNGRTKPVKVATEKNSKSNEGNYLMVSDVKNINNELYYNYGCYQGSGSFWCGNIKKLTVDGEKKTICKNINDDRILVGNSELYYSSLGGDNYKYNLQTGKKSKYSLAYEAKVSYTIVGDKTYMADVSDKNKICISRFRSGTARQTLTKNFISFAFKQKSKINYSVTVKPIGIYNMICVTGIDFSNPDYGWRGRLDSIDWYITDRSGKVLGSFR